METLSDGITRNKLNNYNYVEIKTYKNKDTWKER